MNKIIFSKNLCKVIWSNKESCGYGNGHVITLELCDSLERMKCDKQYACYLNYKTLLLQIPISYDQYYYYICCKQCVKTFLFDILFQCHTNAQKQLRFKNKLIQFTTFRSTFINENEKKLTFFSTQTNVCVSLFVCVNIVSNKINNLIADFIAFLNSICPELLCQICQKI